MSGTGQASLVGVVRSLDSGFAEVACEADVKGSPVPPHFLTMHVRPQTHDLRPGTRVILSYREVLHGRAWVVSEVLSHPSDQGESIIRWAEDVDRLKRRAVQLEGRMSRDDADIFRRRLRDDLDALIRFVDQWYAEQHN